MKISVVVPAYNAEKHIARAIESVLSQTRPADEVIVVDDGSSDGTTVVIRSFGERVKLIQQENAGASVARNTGIEAATGDWIAFLDSDDEWLPEKLKLQTEHLLRHPDLKWTYSNFYLDCPNAKKIQPAHVSEKLQAYLGSREIAEDYLRAETSGGYVWTGTLVVHRNIFDSIGVFEVGMKRAQDVDLWYRIAYQYPRIGYLSKPLAIYHMDTPESSTKVNDQVEFMVHLVQRHQQLSEKYGRHEAFYPCIAQMVKNWIRQLFRQKRYEDIRLLLEKFSSFLSPRFMREVQWRLFCPVIFSPLAELIHGLKKHLKLFMG